MENETIEKIDEITARITTTTTNQKIDDYKLDFVDAKIAEHQGFVDKWQTIRNKITGAGVITNEQFQANKLLEEEKALSING
ncbi:MAG: hypothetical protein KW793_03160 [Candidatus Doudnabacteria bacterium]|nr:hypothetical protein [Candidatus Doudnabacteria bacterium]